MFHVDINLECPIGHEILLFEIVDGVGKKIEDLQLIQGDNPFPGHQPRIESITCPPAEDGKLQEEPPAVPITLDALEPHLVDLVQEDNKPEPDHFIDDFVVAQGRVVGGCDVGVRAQLHDYARHGGTFGDACLQPVDLFLLGLQLEMGLVGLGEDERLGVGDELVALLGQQLLLDIHELLYLGVQPETTLAHMRTISHTLYAPGTGNANQYH